MTAHQPDTAAGQARLPRAVHAVAEDIAALLRSGADPGTRIPGAEWTVGEAAAHLAMANELMADLAAGRERPYGDGTPGSLAAANAASLAALPERDPGVLAAELVRHTWAFTEAAGQRPPQETVVTPLGPMDLDTLGSYLLTHMLGHGYDIAVALGRPHMIDRERVDLSLPFLMLAMPRVVDARAAAGHTARYEMRVHGCRRFTVTFTDGAVTVDPSAADRPDCTILSGAVAFFLIALGRYTANGAIARGRICAWGRKPWLAPRFPRMFVAP